MAIVQAVSVWPEQSGFGCPGCLPKGLGAQFCDPVIGDCYDVPDTPASLPSDYSPTINATSGLPVTSMPASTQPSLFDQTASQIALMLAGAGAKAIQVGGMPKGYYEVKGANGQTVTYIQPAGSTATIIPGGAQGAVSQFGQMFQPSSGVGGISIGMILIIGVLGMMMMTMSRGR